MCMCVYRGIKLDPEQDFSSDQSPRRRQSTTIPPEMSLSNHTVCFFTLAAANSTAPDNEKIYYLISQPIQR